MATAIFPDKKGALLKNQLANLVRNSPWKTVDLDSQEFWYNFEHTHQYLPEPSEYGIADRSEFFKLFDDVFQITKSQITAPVVSLRESHSARSQNEKSNTTEEQEKDSSKQLKTKLLSIVYGSPTLSLSLNSFWDQFSHRYGYIPLPKEHGYKKRNKLLKGVCEGVVCIRGKGTNRVVCLSTVEESQFTQIIDKTSRNSRSESSSDSRSESSTDRSSETSRERRSDTSRERRSDTSRYRDSRSENSKDSRSKSPDTCSSRVYHFTARAARSLQPQNQLAELKTTAEKVDVSSEVSYTESEDSSTSSRSSSQVSREQQLKHRIVQLLSKSPTKSLPNSQLWNQFKTTYVHLPKPRQFKLKKRIQLFSLFPDICYVELSNDDTVVYLKKGDHIRNDNAQRSKVLPSVSFDRSSIDSCTESEDSNTGLFSGSAPSLITGQTQGHIKETGKSDRTLNLTERKEKLRTRFIGLLSESKTKSLPSANFWNLFKQRYGYLPRPLDFGLGKRSQLYDLCDDVIEVSGTNNTGVIKLKSADKLSAVNAKTQPPTDADKLSVVNANTQPPTDPKLNMWNRPRSESPANQRFVPYPPHVPTVAVPPGAHIIHFPQVPVPVNPYNPPQQQPATGSFYDRFYDNSARPKSSAEQSEPSKSGSTRSREPDIKDRPVQPSPSSDHAMSQRSSKDRPVHSSSSNSHAMSPGSRHSMPIAQARYDNRGSRGGASRVRVTKEDLDRVVEDSIDRIAESKEYVCAERIVNLVLQHYSVDHLYDINNLRRIEHISAVNEHVRKQAKVNAYIESFVLVRSIATLYELQEDLKEFCASGQEFDTLKLGPLEKQPVVYEHFKFPSDKSIPEVRTTDVLEHLRKFLSAKDLWTSRNLDLQEFMAFVAEEQEVETPFELGIRMRSMALAVQVLKRSQSYCGQALRNITTLAKETVEQDLTVALRNFSSSVLHKEPGLCVVRQEYLNMDIVQILEEVLGKYNVLINTLTYIGQTSVRGHQFKEAAQMQKAVATFLRKLRNNSFWLRLFKVAVCCSKEEMHEQLTDLMGWREQQEVVVIEDGPPGSPGANTHNRPRPPLVEIISNTKKYLERCILQGPLSLSHLARVEGKLLEDFQLPDFVSLGTRNTFLQFLLVNEDIKHFLEEHGGTFMGLSTSSGIGESSFHPSFSDVLDFVKQCAVSDPSQYCVVEEALCAHYRVREAKALGHGSVAHLADSLKKQKRQHGSSVIFEAALCADKRSGGQSTQRKVGVLGHQTKEKALACLQNCPLLEDMAEWSQWDLVFQPELGDLKDFVQKYGGIHNSTVTDGGQKVTMTTNFLGLESKPGVLLKITEDTSEDKFAKAAIKANVDDTCGHLVSLIVTNRGLKHTPLMLLSNHMKTALLKMQAEQPAGMMGSGSSQNDTSSGIVRYVLNCMVKLPVMICQASVDQVFLEPLGNVIGSAKCKELLLRQCVNERQRGRLQLLGFMLGVDTWARGYTEKTSLPKHCLQQPDLFDQGMGDIVEISDSSSSEEESDSDIDFLSDDEDIQVEAVVRRPALRESNSSSDSDDPRVVLIKSDTENEETLEGGKKPDWNLVTVEDNEMEETGSETSAGVSECKVLIEQIRKEEFGVDVVLSEDGQVLMTKQQERLGRSLQRLSRDLYSKDTHFVLELIQNADDNTYPNDLLSVDAVDCPALKFVVAGDCITVTNNEVGFHEPEIRAICDVGRSTKGKHKFGYIGQKGIGFKSIFRVTDRPEVHSNGYHIYFDVHSGPNGYIMPHWTDDVTHTTSSDNWTTTIVLPLKAESQSNSADRALAGRFHDIHPSLLLFLHRLRSITLENKVTDVTLTMRRRDLANDVIEIEHNDGTDRWLVVKKMLDASQISLQAKSGVEVESTEIAIAFPLLSKENILAQVVPQKQPVFAFLPLRSYGFRFIVHGDFDVPSSREDVDKDSMWNQWIRSEIHTLFVEALDTFKNHDDFDVVEALCRFIQFVPLEDEILDFFRPVATNILQQLRARPCLPTQPSTEAGIRWKMPSQLVVSRDPYMKEVVSGGLLRQHFNLDFLHHEVASSLTPSLLQNLGVQTLSTQHLMEVGKVIVDGLADMDVAVEEERIARVAKWIAAVYRSVNEFEELHHREEVMSQLKSLRMIPLVDGQIVSLDDKTVFFPLDDNERRKKRKQSGTFPLDALERDLRTINSYLVHCLDEVANSQVRRLLEGLGVKAFTASDLVHHHILPVLKTDAWKSKSTDLLVTYIVYIKMQLDQQSTLVSVDELREAAVVLTSHGLKKPTVDAVHFTPKYGIPFDLQNLLPGYDWVTLHPAYLAGSTTNYDIQRWQEFFAKLGVLDFLAVKPEVVTVKAEDLSSSPWASYKDLLPTSDSYQVDDVSSRQLEQLILHNTAQAQIQWQMRNLFELLDQSWDSKYAKYITTKIKDSEGSLLREVETSFALLLRLSPWLPVEVKTWDDDSQKPIPETKLMTGCQIFIRSQPTERLLLHHVPYLICQPLQQSTFCRFLQLQNVVTMEFLRKMLIHFSKRHDDQTEPRQFLTSLAHMKIVYAHLQENSSPKELQDLLHENPIIFTLTDVPANPRYIVAGCFMSRDEVCWHDTTGLFAKYKETVATLGFASCFKHTIKTLYPELEDFFLRSARLQPSPDLLQFANLMIGVAQVTRPNNGLVDMLKICSTIGTAIHTARTEEGAKLDALQLDKIKTTLADQRVFPVKGNHWVKLEERPLVADDKFLETLFKNKKSVHLFDFGEKLPGLERRKLAAEVDMKMVRVFLSALGVGLLSECVTDTPTTEMYHPCPLLQKYVHDVLPYIQKLLLTQYDDVYEQLKLDNVKAHLAAMQFAQVSKLELVYSLNSKEADVDRPSEVVVLTEKCRMIGNNQFVVHKDQVQNFTEINKELSRFFSKGNRQCQAELRNFLLELLPLIQDASPELERFVNQKDISSLPEDEEQWEVPEPVIFIPPPVLPPVRAVTPVEMSGTQDGQAENVAEEAPKGLKAWPPGPPRGFSHTGGRHGEPLKWEAPKAPDYTSGPRLAARWPPSDADRSTGEHSGRSSPDTTSQDVSRPPRQPGEMSAPSRYPDDGVERRHVSDVISRQGSTETNDEGATSGDRSSNQWTTGQSFQGGTPRDQSTGRDEPSATTSEDNMSGQPIDPDVPVARAEPDMRTRSGHDDGGFTSPSDQTLQTRKRMRSGESLDRGQQPKKPFKFIGLPLWTVEAEDNIFEDLPITDKYDIPDLPEDLLNADQPDSPVVGHWGELLVKNYLEQQVDNPESAVQKVEWRNEGTESGSPFDFVVYVIDGDVIRTIYVEVKSTVSGERSCFPISVPQIKLAEELKDDFHLYRVFNVSDWKRVRLTKLENLAKKLETKQVRLLLAL